MDGDVMCDPRGPDMFKTGMGDAVLVDNGHVAEKSVIGDYQDENTPVDQVRVDEPTNCRSSDVRNMVVSDEQGNYEPVRNVVVGDEQGNYEPVRNVVVSDEQGNYEPVRNVVVSDEQGNYEPVMTEGQMNARNIVTAKVTASEKDSEGNVVEVNGGNRIVEASHDDVTLGSHKPSGGCIDCFSTTSSELLKRRGVEIALLRQSLEEKMKRNSSRKELEESSLLSDQSSPARRTIRRRSSFSGFHRRDSVEEDSAPAYLSRNNGNCLSCSTTPQHQMLIKHQVPAIDPKKLKYLLGDCSSSSQRCSHTCTLARCHSPCHGHCCSSHIEATPSCLCHNNRRNEAHVRHVHHQDQASESCSKGLCCTMAQHNRDRACKCGGSSPSCNNYTCYIDSHCDVCHPSPTTIPYTCGSRCSTPPSSCRGSRSSCCDSGCHCSDGIQRSLETSAVSSPCMSQYSSPQRTCRSPNPCLNDATPPYHTPIGSPRPSKPPRTSPASQGWIEEEDGRINYYPNCDPTIWLRSCEQEVIRPLHGTKSGVIPEWLSGTLIRNGPGRIQVGGQQYNHLFDGSALLHRFHFDKGTVTYQNKFLESRSYLRDTKAQRIVVNYFGTRAHPDPCKTILQNVASKFSFEEHFTDNAQISLYPYGDGLYALTETPFLFRVDPETLNTHEKVDLTRHVAVLTHTAHPHVDHDGTVYNIGQGVGPLGPRYHVCKFPKPKTDKKGKVKSPFEQAHIVGSVNARWRLNPCYMHSFAMTPNYWVIIEQPMVVSVSRIIKVIIKQDALIDALQWWEKETKIHVIRRDTGQPTSIHYVTETFFFLHTINAYEDQGHIVLDIAAYRNADMLNCMFVDALRNAAYDPTYAQLFRGRPKRWVLPLNPAKDAAPGTNLVTLPNTQCRGKWSKKGVMYLMPELLSDIGCEVPRIHYDEYNGRSYQYFYAICSDVDHPSPGTLVKVDVVNKQHVEWSEDNVYPSEPVFIPRPGAQREDDGVVVSALLRAKGLNNQVCMVVLDAASFTELGRVEFLAPGPVPKCLHGWFVAPGTLGVHKEGEKSQGGEKDVEEENKNELGRGGGEQE